MSNENFITPEIMQAGIDIYARGNALNGLSEIAIEQAQKRDGNSLVPITGEAGLTGAIMGIQSSPSSMTAREYSSMLNAVGSNLGLNVREIQGSRYWVDRSVEAINIAKLETIGSATELLGSILHDDWRDQSFSNGEGGFNPRVKCLVDREGKEKWVNEDALIDGEIPLLSQDIANTVFENLDPYWQKDNREAAQTVVEIIVKRDGKIDLDDPEVYEQTGNEIHEAWKQRQEKSGGWIEPGLENPFPKLTKEQQEKDINQMRLALKVFGLDTSVSQESNIDHEAAELIVEEAFRERFNLFKTRLESRGIELDWLPTDLDMLSLADLPNQLEDEGRALQARVINDAMAWIDQVLTEKDFVPDPKNEIYEDYRDEALQKIGFMLEFQPEEVSVVILDAVESIIGTDFARLPMNIRKRLDLLSMSGQVKEHDYDTQDMLQEIRLGLLLDLQSQLRDAGSNIEDRALNTSVWELLQIANANELQDLKYEDFIASIPLLEITEHDFNAVKDAVLQAYRRGLDSAD